MYYDQYGNPVRVIGIDEMNADLFGVLVFFFFIAVGFAYMFYGPKGSMKVSNWTIALPFKLAYWVIGGVLGFLGQKKKK